LPCFPSALLHFQELLSDPAARRQLLQALQAQPARTLTSVSLGGCGGPAAWAVAGSVMAGLVVAVAIRQSPRPAMEVAKPAPPAQSISIPAPAEPVRKPKVSRDEAQSEEKRGGPAE